jgi:cold shock protein
MEQGSVREWHPEEGWGVLDSTATPGGCWAHFSSVEAVGYVELAPGAAVTFTFEPARQDGYEYRAQQVWPEGVEPGLSVRQLSESGSAYRSTLTITLDDGRTVTDDEASEFLRPRNEAT